MDKNEFKTFCKKEFQKRGFKKVKREYFLAGKEILCGMHLQKSDYGPVYYINYYYFIGDYTNTNVYPTYYDSDIDERMGVMSKVTEKGEYYITAQIEYEKYTEDELRPYFEKEFEENVLPPVYLGKKFILDNLGKRYSLTLNREEVMRKLQE